MKTTSPSPALTHERCQYRTPKGRQCASRILDPESNFCPRHFASQPPDSQNFSAVLTENACDFRDPQGINHSLAALYKLLASGRISPRRATGLAYIASLLLRTLPAIDKQLNAPVQYEIDVPPRSPRPHFPEDDEPLAENPLAADTQHNASRNVASHQPPTHAHIAAGTELPPQACLPAQAAAEKITPAPPSQASSPRQDQPPGQAPTPWNPSSNFPRRAFEEVPFRSIPVFRRRPAVAGTHPPLPRSWKQRFNAVASLGGHFACAPNIQLAPLQLRLARIHHSRRQANRPDLFRCFPAANLPENAAPGIRGHTVAFLSYLRRSLISGNVTAGIV